MQQFDYTLQVFNRASSGVRSGSITSVTALSELR